MKLKIKSIKKKSTLLSRKNHNPGHETVITLLKENKQNNYKTQFPTNLMLKEEINKKQMTQVNMAYPQNSSLGS
jgi:hypothetical protein